MPPELTAALKKFMQPAPKVDLVELEERIMVKCKRELIKLLITADVLPQTVLDAYEQKNAAILRPDSNIANAAFGALNKPAQAPSEGS